ncbi:VOC family protein [Virgibacillus siamensis]|uniref:VOC family protein n=1 Tax=Virgibacillus siamensis TaxID=480071 RepID=UPI0011154919|nr:VOC family protein [Virgibacillus siamensis]
MKEILKRVGTTYLPVSDVEESAKWYTSKLGAEVNYQDTDKAILNFADQSFFLVRAKTGENANFYDVHGTECFSITFEVDGAEALKMLRNDLFTKGVRVGEIEDRGHSGNNFVFYDSDGNKFDVWSELSPTFKRIYRLEHES